MNMEDIFSKLMVEIKKGNERTSDNEMQIKNQNAAIKNIEMQLGQIHNTLSQRPQGSFPSDTEKNPREHVNAIALMSGTTYDEPRVKVVPTEAVKQNVVPEEKEKELGAEEEEAHARDEKEKERARVEEGVRRYKGKNDRIPFPGRLKKQTEDNHYKKFLDMFRSLHINIPFANVLEQCIGTQST